MPTYFKSFILHWKIKKILKRFRYLTADLFAALLDRDYRDRLYLYERRIHKQKKYLLSAIISISSFSEIIDKLQSLFEHTLDYAKLRWRITDYADLSLCYNEILALSKAFDLYFYQLIYVNKKNKKEKILLNVKENIEQFENIYQNILAVAASDPVIFLLFIHSLNIIYETLAELEEAFLCLK